MTLSSAQGDPNRRPRSIVLAVLLGLGILLFSGPDPAAGQEGAEPAAVKMGKLIRVALPITDKTVNRVKRFVYTVLEKAEAENVPRPVLIFQFEVAADQDESARQSEFPASLSFAYFLCDQRLNAARTVAYVPGSLPGHAVLVAMACDEIMMAADGQFGPVRADLGTVDRDTLESAYTFIANARKTVPTEVALWLLQPSREVLKVETDAGREYVTRKQLEALAQQHAIKSEKPLSELAEGPPGQFTGDEARRLDCVGYMPSSRNDVAKELDLPPDVMNEDPSMLQDWVAVRVNLRGPVTNKMVRQAQQLIEEEIRQRDVNFICLWIDSGGGSPVDSLTLAAFLDTLDPDSVRTVAYIPTQARADAALIAMACNQVVMHPRAELGGSGEYELLEEEIRVAKESIRARHGAFSRRSWSLIAAMIDPKLEVFRCTRPGEIGYFCDEELRPLQQDDPAAQKWRKGKQVTRSKLPLTVDGERAVEFGLANTTVDGFAALMEFYGLENDPTLLEPGWADFLITALASPGVSALLLTIAFVALYAELHAPGLGIGGFVATVCFLLFFWSHYLDGDATWLEITLFVAGISCLLLEIFVLPGFGIFGLGGGCLVLASLILASQTFVFPRTPSQVDEFQWSLLTIVFTGVGIVVAAVMLRKWLPHAPILSHMLLPPPAGEEAENIRRHEALVDLDDFVGVRGTATTQLTPSGKARFGEMLADVITDGDVIARGTEIEVVEVHGNRVIVKAVSSG